MKKILLSFAFAIAVASTVSSQSVDFTIYPNPASSEVSVRLVGGDNDTLTMRSVLGSLVGTYTITGGRRALDLDAVAPGIYLVQVGGLTKRLQVTK